MGGVPTFLVDVCHQHCIYLMKHVCVDDLLPLNKVMVFTVLEVSRQAIVICSSSECPQIQCNKTALRLGHYVICGHCKRLIGCYW